MGFDLSNYEPVEERIDRFYNDFPNGRIITEIEAERDDFKFVVFKASVYRSPGEPEPAATGFAYEVKMDGRTVNATSHIENCETSAIGRALANLNYAAKGKRASQEEMAKASGAARPSQPTPKPDREAAPATVPEPRVEKTTSPPAHEQVEEGKALSPDPSSLALIEEQLADKKQKHAVLAAASKVCVMRDFQHGGLTYDSVKNLPADILDEIAEELRLRQGELV